ncbi:hypothetical protein [Latilactobacillus fuchuensis]|uniref:hypothetical protein n=1 Tax=Latilactobacillus fuchuensis TaxID=164393 RepID=UPI0039AF4622
MTNLKYALINNVNYCLLLLLIAFGRQSSSLSNQFYWFEAGTLIALMIGYLWLLSKVIYRKYPIYNPRNWQRSKISWGVIIIGTLVVIRLLFDFERYFVLICGTAFIIGLLRDYFSVQKMVED